jgi:hypothetical protein
MKIGNPKKNFEVAKGITATIAETMTNQNVKSPPIIK